MKRHWFWAGAMAAALAMASATGLHFQRGASPPGALSVDKGFVRLGSPVDFQGLDLIDGNGAPVDLGPYEGKALLVNLWATWCAPCVAELPSLAGLETRLKDKGFRILPIAIDERDPGKVATFLADHAIGLPAILDRGRSMDRLIKVTALPTSLLVDRHGTAMAAFVGTTIWDCGAPLEIVSAFIASGTISEAPLAPCK